MLSKNTLIYNFHFSGLVTSAYQADCSSQIHPHRDPKRKNCIFQLKNYNYYNAQGYHLVTDFVVLTSYNFKILEDVRPSCILFNILVLRP